MSAQHFTLNNGLEIPAVGLGTWQAPPGQVRSAVAHALKSGYRHLDCALIYQNEVEVGQGIKDSGVPRSDIFITSKVWNTHQPNVAEGLKQTLTALQTDYVDLYLIHWPVRLVPNETSALLPVNPDGTRSVDHSWDQAETWRQMEELYLSGDETGGSGPIQAIGLANWSIPYLEKLKQTWKVVPAVNQVELHPFLPQHKLNEYCQSLGILLEAYSPLGSTNSPLLADAEIGAIAQKAGLSVPALLLSYSVTRGIPVLPKSVSFSRIEDNLRVCSLSKAIMTELNGLAAKGKAYRGNTPKWGSDLGYDDWYGPKP